ncbi:MAG TPA: polysaccharide pyruvyl transferase family protein [Chthoniobacterales bacterium]
MNRAPSTDRTKAPTPLRIYLENGTHDMRNLGDAAMLTEAYRCIRAEWPDADVYVSTGNPGRLERYCPGAIPVNVKGRRSLSVAWAPWRRLETRAPGLSSALRRLRLRHHSLVNRIWIYLICRYLRQSAADVEAFIRFLHSVDVLFYSGGGYFNDEFRVFMHELVSVGEIVQRLHRPVVAFGQGIGPLSTALVARPVEGLLRGMTAVGARENTSLQWVESRRVSPTLCRLTGDDALLAPDLPWPQAMGDALGVNVRLSHYSGVELSGLRFLKVAVARFLEEMQLRRAQPVLIKDTDYESTRQALGELPLEDCPFENAATLRAISACRVVLTGSYHAAVFAYALGVTVVGLAANPYYRQKLGGVAESFGTTPLVFTPTGTSSNDRDAAELQSLLHSAWTSAPDNHEPLLEARRAQIAANRSFKREAFDLVNAKVEERRPTPDTVAGR